MNTHGNHRKFLAALIGVVLAAGLVAFGCAPKKTEEGAGAGKATTQTETTQPAQTDSEKMPPAQTEAKNIVQTAMEAGTFTELTKALAAAELVSTLEGAGPFTVFAPNDEAFRKIPAADLEALMADKPKLAEVLKHHVVAGRITADDLKMKTEIETIDGRKIPVTVEEGAVKVGGATVLQQDVEASNGVIHVIDTVLMP